MSRKAQRTYRRVVTTFWTDPDLRKRKLTRDQKLLLLYLFTNPRTTISGLYWMPLTYAAQETEIPIEAVEQWVQEDLSPYVTYDLETEEILVHRLAYHNIGEELKKKDNRVGAIERSLGDAHSDRLVEKWFTLHADWPIDRGNVAPVKDSEGASKGLPLGAPEGLPLGASKGLGVAKPEAVAVAVAEAVQEDRAIQSPPPAGYSEGNVHQPPPQEVGLRIDREVTRWQDTAIANITDVHGSAEPVRIHGQLVGLGIDVMRYRRICALHVDPPEIIAQAIAFLPEVTGLTRPVSLALWENDENGLTDAYRQCVHRVHTSAPAATNGVEAKSIPPKADPSEAQREARRQLEQLRAAEATS